MADSWGPVEKPTGHFNERAPGADGEVSRPHVGSSGHNENYNATDGRHNKADHQGWPSVDPMSGLVTDTQWDHSVGHFPDGPGAWRQT
jgi:hypothetical protein